MLRYARPVISQEHVQRVIGGLFPGNRNARPNDALEAAAARTDRRVRVALRAGGITALSGTVLYRFTALTFMNSGSSDQRR